jgi:hypothetical protein
MLLLSALALSIALIAIGPRIDAWERANGYPFGKLCEVYRNCH